MRRILPIGLLCTLAACGPEKPPAPERARRDASEGLVTGRWHPETDAALTYAADGGRFVDASRLDDVPEEARGFVRVAPLAGEKAPAGHVWVSNLSTPEADGSFVLRPVARGEFEELCLEGRSSRVKLPEGLEAPDVVPKGEGIVVYKTEWCGVCKQLLAYLDRKGVEYEVRDIEADQAAAAEMSAKVRAIGGTPGSVPVIDVRGDVLIGFDRSRLEKLL